MSNTVPASCKEATSSMAGDIATNIKSRQLSEKLEKLLLLG
jgi:hypothetical protein